MKVSIKFASNDLMAYAKSKGMKAYNYGKSDRNHKGAPDMSVSEDSLFLNNEDRTLVLTKQYDEDSESGFNDSLVAISSIGGYSWSTELVKSNKDLDRIISEFKQLTNEI